ncbi:hypothetical protein AWW66_22885 [Micromonospora rosaria]|uniref:Uncharacterized protein n=1 Tax=Micromonospora rosaria TaxID=47874 RepID=A0A136PML2_9ACTN|nr:hypothetical protein AWW66_22885 [Micromonospora rosaria]
MAAGHELFVKTRTKIVDALDVYLGDLRSVELQDHPSLLLLLEDLAASRITVIASLDAAMGATPPPTQGLVREALDNAIEHARQHVTAPDECYCGEYFSLSEEQKSVALSVVK